MPTSERRPLLVSKGWVQAVVLVVLFGFFVLGLLAYRTYMAKPPTRSASSIPPGRCSTPAPTSTRASRCSSTTGSWSTAPSSATAPTSGPDYTADYLRRASDFVTRAYGGAGSDSAARRTIAEFRTNRYDERTGTLTLTAAQAEAYRRLVGHYSPLLLRADDRARPAAERDHRPHRARGS